MSGPAPIEGGATEVFLHERASATPLREVRASKHVARAPGATVRQAPIPLPLAEAQRWFSDAVTGDDLDAVGEDAACRVVTPGPRMSALDWVGIYHHGYRARLVECLADDYPALKYALGEERFEELALAYMAQHPSRSPNLNAYGRHMAAFCTDPFASDLARLEWALVEVLHAREAERLRPEALAAIPMEQWAAARLPASATARLLRFAFPVNAFFQAWRTDGAPEVPSPAPSATVVYRRELVLWRMDLTPPMASLLERLFAGQALGAALESIEADTPEALAEAERSVMVWFREWVSGGVFARVEL